MSRMPASLLGDWACRRIVMENDIYPIRLNMIPLKVALAAWMMEGADARPDVSHLGKVVAKGAGRHLTWHGHLSCPTSKALVALARSGTSSTEIMDLPDPVLTHGQVRPCVPVSFP